MQALSNSVYGKTIERNRGRIDMYLVSDEDTFARLVANPRFISFKIINEQLSAVFLNQPKVKLDRLYLVGFSILELAKLQMYVQYYTVLKPNLKDLRLLMSDTDSVLCEYRTKSVNKSLSKIKEHFDFSNYPPSHKLFNSKTKNQLGLWKDECEGVCEIT